MMTDLHITHPAIHAYLEANRPPSDPTLRAMEEYGLKRSFPFIGPQCGRVLSALTAISGATRIFELGSGFGYSMYWMAKAMTGGGLVIGTDRDPRNAASAWEFFRQGGLLARTDLRTGDATGLFAAETGPFDMVVCDIDKEQYPEVFELAKPRLRRGGILVADNLLRGGKVTDLSLNDPATAGIREFTRRIFADPDFFSLIIPIRDGLSISVKTGG
jgi:predicted O-methyltransferase YrrM